MDNLIGPAVVAAASGLAFLAYKHPTGYKLFSRWVSLISVLILLPVLGWILAIGAATTTVEGVVSKDVMEPIRAALRQLMIPDGFAIGYLAAVCYIWLLESLPIFSTKEDEQD